jgi:hypothetical protein
MDCAFEVLLYRVFQKGWVQHIPRIKVIETMKKVPMNVGSQIALLEHLQENF